MQMIEDLKNTWMWKNGFKELHKRGLLEKHLKHLPPKPKGELRCVYDYETRSTAPLTGPKSVGSIEYSKHDTTSIFCVGYKINNGPKRLWIPERGPMPDDLWQVFVWGILVAHNALFERAITSHVLTRYELLTPTQKLILKMLPPSRWRCTAAKAAAASLPRSLEDICTVLELRSKKDVVGNKLIKKYSRPRKPSKHNPSIWHSNKKDLRRIYAYCLRDIDAQYEVDQELPDLTDDEQKVWELDQLINDRGIMIDVDTAQLILKLVAEEKLNIKKKVFALSKGVIDSATQATKVLHFVNHYGAEMKNLKAPTVKDKLEEKDLHPKARKMLEYRQAASKTSVSKYRSMLRCAGDDHRVRELLLYCGADRTGRWSGKRIQPQNFVRPTPTLVKLGFDMDKTIEMIRRDGLEGVRKQFGDDKVMDVLGACTRGMLMASPGNEFYCADFSAIEARLAFWFAGCEDGLQAFRDGKKIYEEMAGYAFGLPPAIYLSKEFKESLERFVGKESILGCQYGMGAPKFLSQCHQKGMKSVTIQIAKKAVYAYRDRYPEIQQSWNDIEAAVIKAIQNPGEVYKTNRVSIYVKDKFLLIKLPSGRKLKYFKPRVVYVQKWGKHVPEIRFWTKGWKLNPKTGKMKKAWTEVKYWGGPFFNNIVQGCSRDLMVYGIRRIEAAEYKFVLSVHDEGLSEKKKGYGTLEEYLHLMAGELPAWGAGIPMKAEGWVGQRYRK